MPGNIGYSKSINNIKSRQDGVCYFCGKEITGGKDILSANCDLKQDIIILNVQAAC